jgi:hypothetical protein
MTLAPRPASPGTNVPSRNRSAPLELWSYCTHSNRRRPIGIPAGHHGEASPPRGESLSRGPPVRADPGGRRPRSVRSTASTSTRRSPTTSRATPGCARAPGWCQSGSTGRPGSASTAAGTLRSTGSPPSRVHLGPADLTRIVKLTVRLRAATRPRACSRPGRPGGPGPQGDRTARHPAPRPGR